MICGTVKVAVKIRPLVPYELENGSKTCVAVVEGKNKIQVIGSEKSYRFDHVFGPNVNNESFYNSIIKNKVAEVFNDRDVTILAYGHRHSGKTHTMGTNYTGKENMGIIPRAINTLFDIINSNGAQQYKVTVTFTELYNKELYDLFASNKERTERIVNMKKNGSKVLNLTERQVTNVETAMQCLMEGSQKRVTSKKRGYSQSTRSHGIFTVTIYRLTNVGARIANTSKLHLVDLAGAKHAHKNGKKAKVTKDLSAIKDLINHEQKGKSISHMKYQSSKLAILLRESLRENSKVLIIVCVSPTDYCLVETLQTLRYANRLRKMNRDFSGNQTTPFANSSMEAKPNLVNNFEVQQSISTMGVQESYESRTDDNLKGGRILNAQNFGNGSTIEHLDLFQRVLDIDTEDSQRFLTTQSSSHSRDITYETLKNELESDREASLIRNALKSNEFSTIEQEKLQIKTDDDIEANRILDTGNSSKWNINKQVAFQVEVGNDSEANAFVPDAQQILNAHNSSRCSITKQESFQSKVKNNSETNDMIPNSQRILNAQNSSKWSITKQESVQSKVGNDSEADVLIPDAQRSLKTPDSSKWSLIKQESFQNQVGNGTDANQLIPDAQCTLNAQDMSGYIEIQQETFQKNTDWKAELILAADKAGEFNKTNQGKFQGETDDDSKSKSIKNAQSSSECSESKQKENGRKPNDGAEAQSNLDILESNKSGEINHETFPIKMHANSEVESIQDTQKLSKSSKTEQKIKQNRKDDDTEAQSIEKTLESRKSPESEQEIIQSKTEDNAEVQATQDVLESIISNKSEQEIIQSKTNTANEVQKIQDAFVSNKISKSTTRTIRTKIDEETDVEKIQDALKLNKFVKIKPVVDQFEMDGKTTAQSFTNTLKSTKSSKFEHGVDPSETNVNAESIQGVSELNKPNKTEQEMFQAKMDDATKTESFQSPQKSTKSNHAEQRNIPTKRIEDSPSKLFSKIADFFLEPSPTEKKELETKIHNLRKKLGNQTPGLNPNIIDDSSLQECVRLSTTRRENAKLLVKKILDEFQEVLIYIVENSEIRAWIIRVFKRIGDLLDEQKKMAGKMLNCEAVQDEAMVQKYAEHTIRQVDKYHELQGVNRCIALLQELVASLPKQSITIGDSLKNLEDTTMQIKKLEIEKVDLVQVHKYASDSLNESRTLAEYGIDKVLEMDEKISRMWRTRIKQMIAIERREKFDQLIANMSTQIEKLQNASVRLVEQMKDAEKRWNSVNTFHKKKKIQNKARTKKAKNSTVFRKCACKVLDCLSRRCSCFKSGFSCINCDCNTELCQNKENLPANDDLKCACKTDCANESCTCGKNGVICHDNCKCRPQFCKNKSKENIPSTSTDGKMEVDHVVSSLHVNSCMCRENGETCTNCNRSFKLREYKAKARRRLFVNIDHESEENEKSRKRPRLGT